ncbi:UNVERIFIED_CONTAM: ArdC family protein [Raoultella ornithinolytica]
MVPMNALSRRFYHGINIPLLWNSAERQGYESDRWLTFTQIRNSGGNILKGEKSTLAVFYLPQQREVVDSNGNTVLDADGNPKLTSYAVVREFRLFNIQQCEGLPEAFSQPVAMAMILSPPLSRLSIL